MRSRSFQAIFILGLLLVSAAYLAAQFSPRQPKTVALDVGLSGLRISLVLLGLAWVQEYLGKELERKTVFISLTYPVSRVHFVVARFFGITSLLALAALCLAMLLWLMVLISGGSFDQEFPVALGLPFWATVVGVWLDAAVVTAFAIAVTAVSTVPVMPLAVGAAFAVAAKSVGPVADYLARGAEGDAELTQRYGPLLEVIRWILPDLSRLDWRPWPMYSLPAPWAEIGFGALMAAGYAALMLALAAMYFNRREFS
jgi:Cu-processing system permease protein